MMTASTLEAEAPITATEPPRNDLVPHQPHSWVAILCIVLGLFLAVGLGIAAFMNVGFNSQRTMVSATAVTEATEKLLISGGRGDLVVQFSGTENVASFTSESRSATGQPIMELITEGDTMVLRSTGNDSGLGGVFDAVTGTLTLPATLQGVLDLQVDLNGGAVLIDGPVATLHGTMNAGVLTVLNHVRDVNLSASMGTVDLAGGGSNVTLDISAGSAYLDGDFDTIDITADAADIHVDGQTHLAFTAQMNLSELSLRLGPTPPADITISSETGSAFLDLPPGTYQLAHNEGAAVTTTIDPSFNVNGGADSPRITLETSWSDVTIMPW